MLKSIFNNTRKVLGLPLIARSRGSARRFLRDCRVADEVQRDLLRRRIARHADSEFGRDHYFGEIKTAADFRRRVPISGYDRHEPYIDKVRNGDTSALFGPGTKVLMFALTSGRPAGPRRSRSPSTRSATTAKAGRSGGSRPSTPTRTCSIAG